MRVPDENRLGELGSGFKVAMSALDHGRISLGAGCVGIAQGCLDASIAYTKERKQFGRPVASFQLVQELLADIAVETEAARLLVWRAAATADRGERHTVEASIAKYFASEVAVRAANAAVQAHGGYGYVDEYPVGKYLRDARVTTLYEGTSQIQKLLIGRALTGETAFADDRDRGAHHAESASGAAWLDAHHETAAEVVARLLEEGQRPASRSPGRRRSRSRSASAGSTGSSARIDEQRYVQRWTPRRPKSKWSNVNKEIALRLIAAGEMTADGARRRRGREGERRMGARVHRAARRCPRPTI